MAVHFGAVALYNLAQYYDWNQHQEAQNQPPAQQPASVQEVELETLEVISPEEEEYRFLLEEFLDATRNLDEARAVKAGKALRAFIKDHPQFCDDCVIFTQYLQTILAAGQVVSNLPESK